MKRKIRIAAASLMVAAGLIGAVAAPASAAGPPGKGLVELGTWTCDGLGEVELFGPRGFKAASVYTTTGEHLNLISLEIIGISEGDIVDFSKTYGQKSGLTTFTCTLHFEDGLDNLDFTSVVGLVPPKEGG